MYTVLSEREQAELAAGELSDAKRYRLVRLDPEAGGAADFAWMAGLRHDIEGAVRAFRYLAQKAKAGYDPADPRSAKVAASIERHLETLERLQTTLVEPLFPVP